MNRELVKDNLLAIFIEFVKNMKARRAYNAKNTNTSPLSLCNIPNIYCRRESGYTEIALVLKIEGMKEKFREGEGKFSMRTNIEGKVIELSFEEINFIHEEMKRARDYALAKDIPESSFNLDIDSTIKSIREHFIKLLEAIGIDESPEPSLAKIIGFNEFEEFDLG